MAAIHIVLINLYMHNITAALFLVFKLSEMNNW